MGFFKIDRKIFGHWLWEEKPFSKGQAWIDLIGMANYEGGKTLYRGKIIDCQRGTVYRSISFLARRWGWSRDKARYFLYQLQSDNMITIKSTANHTTITLLNYGKFQDSVTAKPTLNRQQIPQKADRKPDNEIRNNKNIKETKNNTRVRAADQESKKGIRRNQDLDKWLKEQTMRRVESGN